VQSIMMGITLADRLLVLQAAGVKLTRKRIALLKLLFGMGNRHLTASQFHEEAAAANVVVSLATVYNTLKLVSCHGLVREVSLGAGITHFDTNVAGHNHIFFEDTQLLIDSPYEEWVLSELTIPQDYEIVRVDLTVRLSPIRAV
jgi:Fur family iron response transcriptional regulator